jgi:hypothetical protein
MKIILLILLFMLVINWLIRLMFPVVIREAMKNMQKRYGYGTEPKKKQKEGEVSIDNVPQRSRKDTEKIGKYVDYEEVK